MGPVWLGPGLTTLAGTVAVSPEFCVFHLAVGGSMSWEHTVSVFPDRKVKGKAEKTTLLRRAEYSSDTAHDFHLSLLVAPREECDEFRL